MLAVLFLWASAIGQDDELLRVWMGPDVWAAAVSKFEGRSVERRNVAAIGCVGMVDTQMSCSWQRREQNKWHKYSGWADLSGETPLLKSATPEKAE